MFTFKLSVDRCQFLMQRKMLKLTLLPLRRYNFSTTSHVFSNVPLVHKKCLITGGSRGIGNSIAKIFAINGGQCTIIGRDENSLREAVANFAPSCAPHGYIVGDVGKPEFWNDIARGNIKVTDANGANSALQSLDILVNAAGCLSRSLLSRTSDEAIIETFNVNLIAPLLSVRALSKALSKPRKKIGEIDGEPVYPTSCVINISSILGARGGHGAPAYAASKTGLISYGRSLTPEYARRGIRINTILPGFVKTKMTEFITADAYDAMCKIIPAGRFGVPHDIAKAALFLATNDYANNCNLTIDGGLLAVTPFD